MEKAYEGILYKTLDSLHEKLARAYEQWEKESMWIQVSVCVCVYVRETICPSVCLSVSPCISACWIEFTCVHK